MSDTKDIPFDIVAELLQKRERNRMHGIYEYDKHSCEDPYNIDSKSIITKRKKFQSRPVDSGVAYKVVEVPILYSILLSYRL